MLAQEARVIRLVRQIAGRHAFQNFVLIVILLTAAVVGLEAGAEVDACAAAAYGMHDRLRVILRRDPAQANDLITGLSPLRWCGYGNPPESVRILLQQRRPCGNLIERPSRPHYRVVAELEHHHWNRP